MATNRKTKSSKGSSMSSRSHYEVESRPYWSLHLEFIITCVGSAVGLGNVWRFPYLAYSHGGGGFLIPYFISLVLMGIPIFFLEISLGQFSSLSIISVWKINPLFKGLGYTIVTLTSIITIYYSVIIAICVYFMFASLDPSLPWMSCDNEWNTCYCRTSTTPAHVAPNVSRARGLSCAGMNFTSDNVLSSSHEYYFNKVLELTSGIDDPGILKWDLTLCNLAVYMAAFVVISKGIKTLGKVSYVSAILPFFLMTTLLIRGLTLPGSQKGVDFYMNLDMKKASTSLVWKQAASQILFSLSCSMGTLTAMASYNKFHSNVVRDAFVIPLINCITSLYAGFAIFTVLGFLAHITGKDVDDVTDKGPGLAFVAYPAALGEMAFPQFWSFLFFLMMFFLGFSSLCPLIETVVTAIQDEFTVLKRNDNNILFRFCMCTFYFLLGLPQTTQGGLYVLDLCDTFIEFPMLMVGLLQLVVVMWIYGLKRFTEDIEMMVGRRKMSMVIFKCYLRWAMLLSAPLIIVIVILYNVTIYNQFEGPPWAEALGWLMVVFIMMWTSLWYVSHYFSRGGIKLLWQLNQPAPDWGPANPANRTLPRYRVYLEMLEESAAKEKEAAAKEKEAAEEGQDEGEIDGETEGETEGDKDWWTETETAV